MNYVEQEIQETILNGWRNNKTPEDVSNELMQFHDYVNNVDKLFTTKRRLANQKTKRKRRNRRNEKQ